MDRETRKYYILCIGSLIAFLANCWIIALLLEFVMPADGKFGQPFWLTAIIIQLILGGCTLVFFVKAVDESMR